MKSNWQHDIRYIDEEFVEFAVERYQESRDEGILAKILHNFSLFRNRWAKDFAPYLDNGLEEGCHLYDEMVWKSATKFDMAKCKKVLGKAFNAYLVSALMNTLKNLKNNIHGKGPRITCPVCGDRVTMIDKTHLGHAMTVERYAKAFKGYPIASWDGKIPCPYTGKRIEKITLAHINKVAGRYYISEWEKESQEGELKCPVTGMVIDCPMPEYPSLLAPGYTADDFMEDFPEFPGIVRCPVCDTPSLEMSQEHLDNHSNGRMTMADFRESFPNITLKAQKVRVVNPYTRKSCDEITFEMLKAAKTTVKEHLERFSTIILDKRYEKSFNCPFTGKKVRIVKHETLEKMGRTVHEFYQVTCKYPFRKFKVKCGICGKWVSNIGFHLESAKHTYATPMTPNDYEQKHGGPTRNIVMSKTFVENEDGERTHIADLVKGNHDRDVSSGIEDILDMSSLFTKFAEDDLDEKIIAAITGASSMADIIERTVEKRNVKMKKRYAGQKKSELKGELKKETGISDFDLDAMPKPKTRYVVLVVPSRNTILARLRKMATRYNSDTAGDNDVR